MGAPLQVVEVDQYCIFAAVLFTWIILLEPMPTAAQPELATVWVSCSEGTVQLESVKYVVVNPSTVGAVVDAICVLYVVCPIIVIGVQLVSAVPEMVDEEPVQEDPLA